MAKRVYTQKALSPEMARQRAIDVAQSIVTYARKDASSLSATIEQWTRRGVTECDGQTIDGFERRLVAANAEVARAEANLAAVMEG